MIAVERERETQVFGMWVFLATELMLFGGLFTAYSVYRTLYPAGFAEGSRHLDLTYGAINTVVLLTSSFTMSLAAQSRRSRLWLVLTALLGLVFMGIKGAEYAKHYVEGMAPGLAWTYAGPDASAVQLFFLAYFGLTGLHSLHLTIGIVLVLIAALARLHATAVELVGLYWHFVDMVWLFLVALLYVESPFALGVAAVAAVLIAAFPMRLRLSPPLTRIVGLAALVWLAILLLGTLDDVLTRGWLRL
jgi:cytochrome c oxidase subunit III